MKTIASAKTALLTFLALAAWTTGLAQTIDDLEMPQRKAGDEPLTGDALTALLTSGVSGRWKAAASGNGGEIEFRSDGTARVTWSSGSAEGRWRIEDNANCTSWNYAPTRASCNVYYRVGDNAYETYHVSDGAIDGGIVFSAVGTGAQAPRQDIGPEAGWQIQEFVVISSSLDRALGGYRDVLKWQVKSHGPVAAAERALWDLGENVTGEQVLLGNAASRYGYVRLVELDGVEQEIIRPGGRWWDTGGMFNLNVLVKDLDATVAGLRSAGWSANNLPEAYLYPGNVKGKSIIMLGPDDVVLSFQERMSPPLKGWPEFDGATHIEVGYQLVTDLDDWTAFHTEGLGLNLRGPISSRGGDKPVGPNDFGLPHNATGYDATRIATLKLREGGEQVFGGREFPDATGYDFSDRAAPPNLGIAVVRFAVPDVDSLAARLQSRGFALQAEPRTMTLHPYGEVRLFAVRTPGSSQTWLEFIEQL